MDGQQPQRPYSSGRGGRDGAPPLPLREPARYQSIYQPHLGGGYADQLQQMPHERLFVPGVPAGGHPLLPAQLHPHLVPSHYHIHAQLAATHAQLAATEGSDLAMGHSAAHPLLLHLGMRGGAGER